MVRSFSTPIMCPVFVGRTPERDALYQLSGQAGNGQGRVALVDGEAGIGKSRLVAEAKIAAAERGHLVLEGQCFQADSASPYAPLLDLFRSYFTRHAPASLADNLRPLASLLSHLLPELALHFPDLAVFPVPASAEPEEEKRRLFATMTHFVAEQAARRPMLLVVEDVHWCDDLSLDFLLHLARRCRQVPLLLLFTFRSDELHPGLRHWLTQLDRERLAQEISLGPLSREETDDMARAILPADQAVDAALLDTLFSLSEGTPFFVEELLKSLITAGAVAFADGAWKCTSRQFPIPRSVQDIVRERTERVSAEARQVLLLAAVAGRRFDFPLLHHVLHCEEAQLLPRMKELIAAQLVIEESADQFAFRHALIRQAIYGELLARERRALHRSIAEALESLSVSPPLREACLADLAAHFYEAGDWAKALEYGQLAGEKALALYAPRAAVEHLTHALDAAEHLQIEPSSKVYHARGRAFETLGVFDAARSDYELALAVARAAADGSMEWRSMMSLGFLWAERDYATAGAWFRQAIDLAALFADPILQARSLNRLGNWLVNTGRIEEGLHAHQEALGIFEQQQNAQGMAETHDLLGITYGMRGDRVTAVDQLGQAIALFRTQGDTQSLISNLAMRALQSIPGASETTVCSLRPRDECVHDASEAIRLARQIESPAGQAFAENALAYTLLSFGELGPALLHALSARRVATEIEHQQWMVATAYVTGRIYLLLLAAAPAIAALEAGLSLAQELGSTFWIATLAAGLGRAHILKRDPGAAQATLQAVMPREQQPRHMAERDVALAWGELALAQGAPAVALRIAQHLLASAPGRVPSQVAQPIPHLLKLQGEALMALSRLDEAVAALEDAKRGAEERNARPVLWTIHRALGQAYQRTRRKDQARLERTAARQLIEELATTIGDAALHDQFKRAALGSLPPEKPLDSPEAARQAFGGLTPREREVAALIAQGRTSREIAALLVISERTAEVHVGNILGKLGFASRAQIAAWVVERGLPEH